MSGVVHTLNEDDEEDVAGLLDENDDDEEDNLADYETGSKSRRKKYGRGKKPYAVVRTGTIGNLMNTFVLCCIFFGIGFTKSLLDKLRDGSGSYPSQSQMASAVGYVLGFLIGGILLSKFSRMFIILLSTLVLGICLIFVPWTLSTWAVDTVYTLIGVALAILMAGGNVVCLDFWGRKSWVYLQALHFCLSMGLLIGPFLVDPLAHTKVPLIVQKALPISGTASPSTTTTPHPIIEPKLNINFRAKRAVDEDLTTEAQTPDPLLLELFKPRIALGEHPIAETTTTNEATSERPKPKPKPVFTDGRKLDNSRDWESVKVAKPPPEEVKPEVKKETGKKEILPEEDEEEEDPPSIEDILGEAKEESDEDVSIEEILGVENLTEEKEKEEDRNVSIEEILSNEREGKENSSQKSDADSTYIKSRAVVSTAEENSGIKEIEEEMTKIREDIQKSQELLSRLESVKNNHDGKEKILNTNSVEMNDEIQPSDVILKRKRYRRSIRGSRQRSRDSFDQPILYNQRQRVPPPAPIYPADNQWPPLQVPPRVPDYPEYGTRFQPAPSFDYGFENRPKKVDDALETLKEYMDGDLITDEPSISPSSTTTSTTTTTTTTTTTKSTTAQASTARISSAGARKNSTARPTTSVASTTTTHPHHKKPTSSFDNDTEDSITIQTYLDNYGVSKPNVGFILDAVYTILISFVLFFCLCYNPREPRSRQEFEGCSTSRKVEEESRIFRYTLTVLLFFFSLLHWGMFVSMQHVLPRFYILASSAPYLQQVFIGVFTLSRFISMFTPSCISPAAMVFFSLLVTFAGSLVLVFTQQLSAVAVWAGVILQAVGLSTLFPSSLVWGEAYMLMTGQVVALICSGLALGELAIPQLFTRLTIEAQTWMGFAMLGATTLSSGLFVCVFLMAKKQGSRFSRPQASGYELANQDELNQELLDEDEADDFEVSEPTLRLNSLRSDEAEA